WADHQIIDDVGEKARFDNLAALAFDNATHALYVSDATTVRKIDLATAMVSRVAGGVNQRGYHNGGGNAALFREPEGLVADGAGHLYVADTGNHCVRKIDLANDIVSTAVGDPQVFGVVLGALPGGLNWPTDVKIVDAQLIILDAGENVFLKTDLP